MDHIISYCIISYHFILYYIMRFFEIQIAIIPHLEQQHGDLKGWMEWNY